MVASKRFTTEPASAAAFGNSAPRSTANTFGATAALKKIAAPSHKPNNNKLTVLRKVFTVKHSAAAAARQAIPLTA
jgi:hypothetical protein